MAYSYDVIIIPKDSTWKYIFEDSLNDLILGYLKGYEYEKCISKHHKNNTYIKILYIMFKNINFPKIYISYSILT
ncbi:MAG: hypothetical protein COA44_06625 [Arcobacter sp.]|nr:MAG: hypothetical protein COA44_06625 [Arcobacter sp.]